MALIGAEIVNWNGIARRRWPRSRYHGNGRYAVLTCCFFHPTGRCRMYSDIIMFSSEQEAEDANRNVYCHAALYSLCSGRHEVVDLMQFNRGSL
jgi:hypothetical protein